MRLARVLLPSIVLAWLAAASAPAMAAVTVQPLSLTEGQPFDGVVATLVSRCDLGGLAPAVAWGDGATTAGTAVVTGQSTYDVRAAHTYAQGGAYTLTVTVKNCSTGGMEGATASVEVADAPAPPPDAGAPPAAAPPPPPPPPPPAHGIAVTGAGRHQLPRVRVHDAITGGLRSSFLAYSPRFRGGVRVAAADVDGDRVADVVTGPGPGAEARVKVFSGADGHLLRSFLAFGPSFRKGVHVAAGDTSGDGRAEIIVGADAGARPHVKVFDGAGGQLRSSFLAYTESYTGGVRVAAGDVDGDRRADVVAATGPGAASHVKVFSGAGGATLMSFLAYGPSFTGGVYVGAADVSGDGRADVIAGTGPGVAAHVKAFSGAGGVLLMSFLPYGSFTGGVRVAGADADGDGRADVLAGAGTQVKAFSGANGSTLASFLSGGAFIAGAAGR